MLFLLALGWGKCGGDVPQGHMGEKTCVGSLKWGEGKEAPSYVSPLPATFKACPQTPGLCGSCL